jgi:hypothetical protein
MPSSAKDVSSNRLYVIFREVLVLLVWWLLSWNNQL